MFHRHEWEEESRQFGYAYGGGPEFTLDVPQDKHIHPYVTCITYRCVKCGHHRQELLRGHVKAREGIPEAVRKAFKEGK